MAHRNSELIQKKPNMMERGWQWVRKYFGLRNQISRDLLAEFFGTLFLVLVGEAAYAVQVLSREKDGNSATSNLAWGFGVFFGMVMTIKISGAILNPAITLAYAFIGKLPLIKVVPYCLVQTLGGFCGAAMVYLLYYDAITSFDGGIRQVTGPNATAHIFATYPKPHIETRLGTTGAFYDQVLATFVLVIGALATADPYNGLPQFLHPFAMAFMVTVNGYAFMYNAGGAMNPARDLGPRIFTSLCGYGADVFAYRNYNWFWIPVIGPLIGGLLAAFVYKMLLGIHHPDVPSPEEIKSRTWHTTKTIVMRNDETDVGGARPEEKHSLVTSMKNAVP